MSVGTRLELWLGDSQRMNVLSDGTSIAALIVGGRRPEARDG